MTTDKPIPEAGEIPANILQEAAAAVERMPHRAPFKADVLLVIARAILAERERCAQIAAGNSADFDFAKALAECRDCEHGFHSGRLHAATAIREG